MFNLKFWILMAVVLGTAQECLAAPCGGGGEGEPVEGTENHCPCCACCRCCQSCKCGACSS